MAKKKTSVQNTLVWILMGLLVVGLAGFGIDGLFSSNVRSIGRVGDRDITIRSYQNALQQEINALTQQAGTAITLNQLRAFGLDQQVRMQLITTAALENESARIGISVGDANVSRTLAQIGAFRGPTGAFDRETYRFALQQVGLTPAEFESDLRREAARGILQAAVSSGAQAPGIARETLNAHYATAHDLTVYTLTEADLPGPLARPDAAALAAHHEANAARYQSPETRHISYAWLTPSMILDTVEVDEASIRALYDSRLSDYVTPERRLVERLVYPDEASAQAAMAELAAGADFETLVAARGLTLDDADMGDVTEAQLAAAGPAVFALEEPGEVAGPLPSPFGPALYRMNAILNAMEISLDEVRAELRAELAVDRARRAIAEDLDRYDDLLAGGASIEDLIAETGMQGGTIAWHARVSDGIAAYDEFRASAAAARVEDFPELLALSDGGVFVLRLDRIDPPAPQPLAEVRDQIEAELMAQALGEALHAMAQTLVARIAADGPDVHPSDEITGITRIDRVPALPPTFLTALLDAEPGAVLISDPAPVVLVAIKDAVRQPDPQDPQTARVLQAVEQQLQNTLSQDLFEYFARALTAEAGITFNQAAIDAVHASFP
jgi:peptidyl-prolyl cis-trans isomerase D